MRACGRAIERLRGAYRFVLVRSRSRERGLLGQVPFCFGFSHGMIARDPE